MLQPVFKDFFGISKYSNVPRQQAHLYICNVLNVISNIGRAYSSNESHPALNSHEHKFICNSYAFRCASRGLWGSTCLPSLANEQSPLFVVPSPYQKGRSSKMEKT